MCVLILAYEVTPAVRTLPPASHDQGSQSHGVGGQSHAVGGQSHAVGGQSNRLYPLAEVLTIDASGNYTYMYQ